MRPTRRAVLGGGLATGALAVLGCAGGGMPPTANLGPPELDPSGDRRPTTGRSKHLPEGFSRVRFDHDGLAREAILYAPPGGGKKPLLMGTHGNSGTAEGMYAENGLGRVCREKGWYGLFPETDVWCDTDPRPDLGDSRFLGQLLDRVVGDNRVDRDRVWLAGFSGGGMKSYRLAGLRSDLVAGIAVCACTLGHDAAGFDAWDPRKSRARPVSILHVHGKNDPKISPEGGEERGVRRVPILEGMQVWSDHCGGREVKDPRPPAGCPGKVRTRRWEARGGWAWQAVIDPDLTHVWASYMNRALVDFLAEVPAR